MNKPFLIATVLVLVAVSFAAGYLFSKPDSVQSRADRKVLYYVDPMNPGFRSDKPGIAPCGMPLEPVYTEGSGGHPQSPSAVPGAIRINPARQQEIGVHVAQVERKPSVHTVRLLGRVVPDEARVYRINTVGDVWAKKFAPPTTGSMVKKDELLFAYYTGQFLPLAASYIYLLDALERQKAAGQDSASQQASTNMQIRQAADSLKNIGITEYQISEMTKARKIPDLAEFRSPVDGIILARNASPGQFVPSATEIYRIGDLSRVWVLVDVFENEASIFKPGKALQVTHPGLRRRFPARVSTALPQFDPVTLTLKVRLEVENPDYALRPDMFVDVDLAVDLPAALTVPADAIIDSGVRKTVYVDRGDGNFEPRRVETGWRLGKMVEITGGLMPGEKIVVSGNFLIDSESRMRSAQGIRSEGVLDPVCRMFVDEDKAAAAGRTVKYQDKTYFFCTEKCKSDFEKDPKQYAEQGAKKPGAKPERAMMKEHGMQEKKAGESAGSAKP